MNRRSQFRFLTRHYFDRFFDKDSISSGSDPRASVIQTISLLAVPGLMLTFLVHILPSFAISLSFIAYFCVSYSMVVTGFVMIFKWDALFPDRRDYQILGSLPIRYCDLFAAKVVSLCLFLGMFVVSSNFFTTLIVPLGRPRGSFLMNLAAHVSGVFGGALFMGLAFTGLQGVLISILPHHLFRRITPVLQMVSITILLTIFLSLPLIGPSIDPLAKGGNDIMEYFPFFWFVGAYLSLSPGGNLNPIFSSLALKAVYGLLALSALCLVTYAIAYKRYAQGVLDAMDFHPPQRDTWWSRLNVMDRALLKSPTQRACFHFIRSILARSAKHQVFLAIYLAIGLSLGLTSLFSVDTEAAFPLQILPDGMLALPLTLSFFVVSGLRATFNIPHELPANWIFQLTDTYRSEEYVTATRKWVAVYGLMPLILFTAVLECLYWPWTEAAFHVVFQSIVSIIVLQVLFFTFQKAPFTCSFYPGKKNTAILAGVYLYGFTTYSSSMVALESWLVLSPVRGLVFLIAAIVSLLALSSVRRQKRPGRLVYEEQSDAQLQTLGLN